MKKLAFLLAMLLPIPALALQDDDGNDGKVQPSRTILKKAVTVPLDVGVGKPVVQVKVNGKGPYPFLLDTCAGGSVINADLVKELGLPKVGKTQLGDPSNPKAITADRIHIDRIEVGDASFEDFEAASWDRAHLYPGKDAPRGILGFPLFSGCLLTLDYVHGKLTLSNGTLPASGTDGVTDFHIGHGGIPVLEIDIAGKTYAAHLDSGAMSGLAVNPSVAEKLPLSGEPTVIGRGRTVNSEFELKASTLDGKMKLADTVFDKPEIVINPILKEVNIGSRLMEDATITFDQQSGRLRFTRDPSAPAMPKSSRPRLGLMMARKNANDVEELSIDHVVPKSPAEKAGLKAGDVITEINGQDALQMTDSAMKKEFAREKVEFKIKRDGAAKTISVDLRGA
ncbi:MAG TPA: aspartyl protease family protein [Phycisphaerae bacterium]|nr:aspartyl protease family protein [Phycisphaerae bacterium]